MTFAQSRPRAGTNRYMNNSLVQQPRAADGRNDLWQRSPPTVRFPISYFWVCPRSPLTTRDGLTPVPAWATIERHNPKKTTVRMAEVPRHSEIDDPSSQYPQGVAPPRRGEIQCRCYVLAQAIEGRTLTIGETRRSQPTSSLALRVRVKGAATDDDRTSQRDCDRRRTNN